MEVNTKTARMVVRWRLMALIGWYGEDELIVTALDKAIAVLDAALVEVEVHKPKGN